MERFGRSTGTDDPFRLVLEPDGGGGHRLVLEALVDGGGYAVTPAGSEAALGAGWHRLRLEWTDSAAGQLRLFVDGVLATELTGLANGTVGLDAVDWGAVDGAVAGPAGTIDVDGYLAWP